MKRLTHCNITLLLGGADVKWTTSTTEFFIVLVLISAIEAKGVHLPHVRAKQIELQNRLNVKKKSQYSQRIFKVAS